MPEGFAPEKSQRLGLAILRTIVESELGGSLRIESCSDAQAHGTHVILEIPWEEGLDEP